MTVEYNGRSPTSVRTSDQTGSHADLAKPFDGVEANIASDEGGIQVMVAFNISINVSAKLLDTRIICQLMNKLPMKPETSVSNVLSIYLLTYFLP